MKINVFHCITEGMTRKEYEVFKEAAAIGQGYAVSAREVADSMNMRILNVVHQLESLYRKGYVDKLMAPGEDALYEPLAIRGVRNR